MVYIIITLILHNNIIQNEEFEGGCRGPNVGLGYDGEEKCDWWCTAEESTGIQQKYHIVECKKEAGEDVIIMTNLMCGF